MTMENEETTVIALARALTDTVQSFYSSRGYPTDEAGNLKMDDYAQMVIKPLVVFSASAILVGVPARFRKRALEAFFRDVACGLGFHLGDVTLDVTH